MSGADPTRTMIPAELVGQARLLRDRLAPDLTVARAKIERALRSLREAARSKQPSDWLIRETGRRWQEATADADRIAFYPPACDAAGRWAIAKDRPTPADCRCYLCAAGPIDTRIPSTRSRIARGPIR
jgi:hypothetical protein